MFGNRLINTNAGGGGCTNTVDLYNPFPDGGGVALYQLNGNATDVSGNYDGNFVNPDYGTGVFGQAGVFNGTSSYVDTSIPLNSNLGSYSLWVKTSDTTGCFFGVNANSDTNRFYFGVRDSNFWTGAGDTQKYTVSASNLIDNNWHNVVITLNGSVAKYYLDGAEVDSTNYTGQGSLNLSPVIGGLRTDLSGIDSRYYTNGSIDQVRIFNRVLRPYEVEALYTEEYCTPTIVPSEHFNTVLFTPTTSTSPLPVTGVGFQPDFVWAKYRNGAQNHYLFDSIRGGYLLRSNTTDSELTGTVYMDSFDPDGFTTVNNLFNRTETDSVVAWNFKAGGAAVTNTDGVTSGIYTGVTSQVSANTDSGFSIQTFTSSGSGKVSWGHGLSVVPKLIILKSRSATGSWEFISPDLIGASYGLRLNTNAAATNYTNDYAFFDSSKIDIGSSNYNISQNTFYVSYAFAEVEGFSNFGSYVGTGVASGNVVVTGFEPAFLMIKGTDQVSDWIMLDNKRDTTNPNSARLDANSSDAEYTAENLVNFLENGFELATASASKNGLDKEFIYMAFAADPTTIEPTLEDSFNTVIWTGDGASTRSITGVGFQPDFVWTKRRSLPATEHHLFDVVRGLPLELRSDKTLAELTSSYGSITSFDIDGFTVTAGANGNLNQNALDLDVVAWCWKGAELPAINSNGSITSVVSANPAAGFSIVSCTATGNADTIGHGLGVAPSVIIYKTRSTTGNWSTYHQSLGNTRGVYVNLTSAAVTSQFFWNNTSPTSDVFTAYGSGGNTHIAYCFAEVAGFSKFGSYTGTGSAGNTVTVGFEPAFIMLKRTDATGSWFMFDNKRNPSNPRLNYLKAQTSDAEANNTLGINFLSNGFDFNEVAFNDSGATFIYMAFANQF